MDRLTIEIIVLLSGILLSALMTINTKDLKSVKNANLYRFWYFVGILRTWLFVWLKLIVPETG